MLCAAVVASYVTAAPSAAAEARRPAAASAATGLRVPGDVYGDAVLSEQIWLSERPRASMPMRCLQRSIYLASGTYAFSSQLYLSVEISQTGAVRRLFLAGDTYVWQTCIRPYDQRYEVWSYLSRPASPVALVAFDTKPFVAKRDSSLASWGSGLIRVGG